MTLALIPGRSATSEGSSKTIRTGILCTTFTKLPEAFSGGKSDMRAPLVALNVSTRAGNFREPRELTLVVGAVPADVYGAHYNDDGSECAMIQSVAQVEATYLTPHGLKLDKPLLMTEGASGTNTGCYVNAAFAGGWAGYLSWGYYGLVGLSDFIRYPQPMTSRDGSPSKQSGMNAYEQFAAQHPGLVPTFP